jgi:hypothetical protein
MEHIPREKNHITDELSKMAAKRERVPAGTFVEWLMRSSVTPKPAAGDPSTPTQGSPAAMLPEGSVPGGPGEETIPGKHVVMAAEESTPAWATELLHYLQDCTLPEEEK